METDIYLLDSRNRLLLTFMKLTNNASYTLLSVLFNVSRNTCARYFEKIVFILRRLLENFIRWPSKSAVIQNLPKCFARFQGTRIVVDASEIPVRKIQCPKCGLQMFSHYKKRHTLKFEVFMTPDGYIAQLSSFYGGKASDKHIFNVSDVVGGVFVQRR